MTIAFDDFCKRLETPIRTFQTTLEYPKLPKAERDQIKDKGGFSGGMVQGWPTETRECDG
jgi:hypothetical protein